MSESRKCQSVIRSQSRDVAVAIILSLGVQHDSMVTLQCGLSVVSGTKHVDGSFKSTCLHQRK